MSWAEIGTAVNSSVKTGSFVPLNALPLEQAVMQGANRDSIDWALKMGDRMGCIGMMINDITNAGSIIIGKMMTLAQIAGSAQAMGEIVNSQRLMELLLRAAPSMDAFGASKTAMDIIAQSQNAMDFIANDMEALAVLADSSRALAVLSEYAVADTAGTGIVNTAFKNSSFIETFPQGYVDRELNSSRTTEFKGRVLLVYMNISYAAGSEITMDSADKTPPGPLVFAPKSNLDYAQNNVFHKFTASSLTFTRTVVGTASNIYVNIYGIRIKGGSRRTYRAESESQKILLPTNEYEYRATISVDGSGVLRRLSAIVYLSSRFYIYLDGGLFSEIRIYPHATSSNSTVRFCLSAMERELGEPEEYLNFVFYADMTADSAVPLGLYNFDINLKFERSLRMFSVATQAKSNLSNNIFYSLYDLN